jgi:hypothetical protein
LAFADLPTIASVASPPWSDGGTGKASRTNAIVADNDIAHRQAQLFPEVGELVRPIRVFREWHEARRWIDLARAAAAAEYVPTPGNSRTHAAISDKPQTTSLKAK